MLLVIFYSYFEIKLTRREFNCLLTCSFISCCLFMQSTGRRKKFFEIIKQTNKDDERKRGEKKKLQGKTF